MKKVQVYWSTTTNYTGEVMIPENLTEEQESEFVSNNLPWDEEEETGTVLTGFVWKDIKE